MLHISGVDHLNLTVNNLNETADFYQKVFGFEEVESGLGSSGRPFKIIGKEGALFLCIYEDEEEFNKDDHGRLGHLGLHSSNFDSDVERLKELGLEILYGGIVEYPRSRSVYIEDPNGMEIEISSKFGGDLK